MGKSLLIVESPAKAKTIGKYLGSEFEVRASVGHIIDLPKSNLGVDIDNGFTPEYVVIDGKQKVISELKKAAKGKETVYLGPDPDREGEAIAWHIAQALGDHNYQRVLLHELTPAAIREAIDHPVPISKTRFESQQTRRILDRLMGYLISPLLWDKLKRGLSAGRVQSVALRLIVERERAIFAFRPEEYWSLTAEFLTQGQPFTAQLSKIGAKKAALKNEEETQAVVRAVTGAEFTVADLVTKERRRHPLAPFTTSTLQQAAFNRLKMASKRAMKVAQDLYEGLDLGGDEGQVGLITYMRTDSVRVNAQAMAEAAAHIREHFGPDHVPARPNQYKNKKGAQDAHEAIRPTSVTRTPAQLKGHLETGHWQLYDLIWRRFVASQMAAAVLDQTTADLTANDHTFRATGSVIKFKGFLSLYDLGQDEDKDLLPPLARDQRLNAEKLTPKQHFTQPPPRFTEATLVKELEEKGIGRPSTYATIISTLKDKEYVDAAKGVLKPTEMGFAVTDLLVRNFPDIMDVDFTAGLEENLDEIEEGRAEHLDVLTRLYDPLAKDLEAARAAMANLRRDGVATGVDCPSCGAPESLSLRYGRNGFYLACAACGATCDFERDEHGVPRPLAQAEPAGECEKCGRPLVVKKSRYGQFLACTGYPECRNAKPLSGGEAGGEAGADSPPPLPEGYPTVCEKCGEPLVVKKNRQGSWFISCSGYPKCRNAKPFPSGVACPKEGCGGEIVQKPSKRGPFYGCSNYPKCRLILKGKPVPTPCPVCGQKFLVENPAVQRDPSAPPLICATKDCPGPDGAPPADPKKRH